MKKMNKKGFTLVELVIVVAVMAVLVAVAIPTVSSITKTAKETVADSNARTIESVIKLAEAEASKDTDGVVELDEDDIEEALTDAKLGITSSNFYYNPDTGVVVREESGNNTMWLISFADNGAATVTEPTATPSPSPSPSESPSPSPSGS